jgi:hypothetical protein
VLRREELLQWTVGMVLAVTGLRIMLGWLTMLVVVIGGVAPTQTTTAVVLTMMRTQRGGR